jgi:hypothetical protein
MYQMVLLIGANMWAQESPKSEQRFQSYEGLKLVD